MEKFNIKNRYGLEIVGDIYIPENSIGLAFVLHGLGSSRTRANIKVTAETFFANNYTVVNFDATNSTGESEGKYENATIQFHYEDLVDVISWSKKQNWYREPFILAGHSLGGYAVLEYAENFPEEVKSVTAFAPTISGKFSFEARERFEPETFKKFKETGWETRTSKTTGRVLNLPFSHMEERLKHDLTINAKNLLMPILIIVGEKDTSCPPNHQKILFDLLPGKKEIHIVPNAPHTFRKIEDLESMKILLDNWIKSLN